MHDAELAVANVLPVGIDEDEAFELESAEPEKLAPPVSEDEEEQFLEALEKGTLDAKGNVQRATASGLTSRQVLPVPWT